MNLVRAMHSLNRLVNEIVSKIKDHQLKGIDIHMSLAHESPQVLIDRDRIEQVILNIIRNAREAMGSSGTLKISTREEHSKAVLSIEDTGLGIPENIQKQIFNPFFTTKKEGTGLGLSISKQIVAEHGGQIQFVSLNGKGTIFKVIFP